MKPFRAALMVTATTVLAMLWASPAWAYLDPGTGSMLVTAVVGLFATMVLTFKTWWYRLLRLFRREQQDNSPPPSE